LENIEIEKKFTVKSLPNDLEQYECRLIEQAYLCTAPVVRVRREGDESYLTYKGSGLLAREEYNLPLDEEAYQHLLAKADGNIISKKRYFIPLSSVDQSSQPVPPLTIELDIFAPPFAPLIIAEVEFPDLASAESFVPPDWFAEDVTMKREYHNSYLSRMKL
jgi:CYTH domain-containing protein